MSAAKVVAKAGLAKDTITRIKLGHTQTPSRRTLRALAVAVGKTLQDVDRLREGESAPERSGTEHSVADLSNRSLRTDATTPTVATSSSAKGADAGFVVPSITEVEGYLLTRLGGVHGMYVVAALAAVLDRHRDNVADVCADVASYIQTKWGGATAGTTKKAAAALRGRR